jgi:hypothetical protein
MEKIKAIILEMNRNRNEDHVKVMRYMNKIVRLFYSEEDENK